MPDWVSVWFWLRFQRDPRIEAHLPQQSQYVDETMSMERYERYLEEWRRSDAPRPSTAQVVAALTGNPILDVELS